MDAEDKRSEDRLSAARAFLKGTEADFGFTERVIESKTTNEAVLLIADLLEEWGPAGCVPSPAQATCKKRGPGHKTHEHRMEKHWAAYPVVFSIDGEAKPPPEPDWDSLAARLRDAGLSKASATSLKRRMMDYRDECYAEQLRVHHALHGHKP